MYHLAHAASYNELEDVFGVSESLGCKRFNKVVRVLVATMYDGFPCVGAWDGFHVYLNSKLKNNFSFKKRYSRTNLGLVSYNKRFLYVGVSAPGSFHDSRLLKSSSIFERVFFTAIFVCVGWNSEKNRKGDLSYSSQLYYRKADVFKNTNPLTLNTLNNNT